MLKTGLLLNMVPNSACVTGYAMMKSLLNLKLLPTAVITGADLLVANILQATGDMNLAVPAIFHSSAVITPW